MSNKSTASQVTRIVPPKVMGMICGVIYADLWPDGNVQLTYEDGETESAYLSDDRLTEGRDNFFRLVSGVQEQRKGKVGHVCTSCCNPLSQTEDNPSRTDWCVICGHRAEGQQRKL